MLTSISLDSFGRWLLRGFDYRHCGILIIVVIALFILRRWRCYKSWPSTDDYLKLVVSLLGIVGGLPVGIVFLLTKPPAVDALSGLTLTAIGLIVPM